MSVIYRALRNLERHETSRNRGLLHDARLKLESGHKKVAERIRPNTTHRTTAQSGQPSTTATPKNSGALAEQLQDKFKNLTEKISNWQAKQNKEPPSSPKPEKKPVLTEKISAYFNSSGRSGSSGSSGSSADHKKKTVGAGKHLTPIIKKLVDRSKRAKIKAPAPQPLPASDKKKSLVPILLATLLVVVIGCGAILYTQGGDGISEVNMASLQDQFGQYGDGGWMGYLMQIEQMIQPVTDTMALLVAQFWPGEEAPPIPMGLELENRFQKPPGSPGLPGSQERAARFQGTRQPVGPTGPAGSTSRLSGSNRAKPSGPLAGPPRPSMGPPGLNQSKQASGMRPTLEMENWDKTAAMRPTLEMENWDATAPERPTLEMEKTQAEVKPPPPNPKHRTLPKPSSKLGPKPGPKYGPTPHKQAKVALQLEQSGGKDAAKLKEQQRLTPEKKTPEKKSVTPAVAVQTSKQAQKPPPMPRNADHKKTLAKAAPPVPQESIKKRAERSYTIPQMIGKLRESIAKNNEQKVNRWLDTLETVKQSDDPYLLNMRAYWYITRQDYNKAEIYLKQVLLGNSDDLEAGINLAIVEAHTNRADEAQQRLHILSQRYPNESRLQYVLNTLR